ncbi:MAG: ArnT family glycosyltransferase [Magnetospiraceae bacterium]
MVYLPGLATIPPLDRDEARFAQASKQMIETGDLIDIRLQDEPRHKKPAGIYWMQAATAKILTPFHPTAIWLYRLPSVVGAIAAVLLTHALALHLFGRRIALIGAGALALSVMLVSEAHQAKTDAMLLATVCGAQLALARLYRPLENGPGAATPYLFWGALGISFMIKGPIGLMVVALTILALALADRRVAWLKPLLNLRAVLLFCLVAAPWYIAIAIVTKGAFFGAAVGEDLGAKLVAGQESHGAPPGYYLLLMVATLWPASLLAWPALVAAWREFRLPEIRFLLAWVVPSWLVFEIVPTKLPHYTLPTYPALAVLAAVAIVGALSQVDSPLARALQHRVTRYFAFLWGGIGGLLAIAAVALPLFFERGVALWSVAGALGLLLTVILTTRWMWQGQIQRILPALTIAALLVYPTVFGGTLPHLRTFFVGDQIAAMLTQIDPDRTRPVSVVGFSEPSMVFRAGTDIKLRAPAEGVHDLAEIPQALVLVEDGRNAKFQEFVAEIALQLRPLGEISGFNYSKGKKVHIIVYERAAGE